VVNWKKEGLTARLIASFKGLIAEGVLLPGCKLPPERELALRFGVSRPSLRQALKVMEIMGVLYQRIGDGTYLNRDASAVLSEPVEFLILMEGISHHELFEFRLILEPELAARAAERAAASDMAELRRALKLMEDNTADRKTFVEADVAFHSAICKASGNRIGQLVFAMTHKGLLNSVVTTASLAELGHAISFHKAIYAAIHGRDAEGARRQMIAHLMDAREVLLRGGPARLDEEILGRIRPIQRDTKAIPAEQR
jgi:GntR family transcriptional repressor for pyruvate dehydrogenase complex